MYNVTNDYRAKVHGEVIKTRMTFEIDGTTYTDENILQGSLTITNQCTDTKDVKIGAVYVGELSATFRNVGIARNFWRGKEITVTFYLQTDEDNDTWEAVPVGVYTVSEAQWKASGVVVKAFDNMAKFDKLLSLNQSGGLLYDFLALASSECDVDLAQTEQELKALPNGLQYFTYFNQNDVETWRDLVSYIAAVYGGFATVNREGKLEIRKYTQTPVDTLNTPNRHTGGTFSDYVTKYTAVSYVAIESKEVRRYAAPVDDGVTMSLGSNPFLQNKSQAAAALPNILAAVEVIRFTPFNFKTASNPAYDLGDVISCSGGIAGTSAALCCVQKFVLQYHKAFRIQGFGADPSLASARSKTDKDIAGIMSSSVADTMGFYEFRNAELYHVEEDQRRRVMTLRVAANAKTRVHFHINVNLETTDTDANEITRVIASYFVNADEDDLHPQETYIDGKHVLHLMYILPMEANDITNFSLYLTSESGTIDIERGGLWAYASGAGLVGDEEWTGIIDIFEDSEAFSIPDEIIVLPAAETIITDLSLPVGATLTDTTEELQIAETSIVDVLSDRVRIVNYEDEVPRCTENETDIRVTEDGNLRYTEQEHS